MKLESKYFDSIRVAGKRQRTAKKQTAPSASDRPDQDPQCQWKGCNKPGRHRAPVGRGRDGEYYFFCMEHVRQYNASYNYFDGMSDNEVEKFQKDALTGHRPTWKMGANSADPSGTEKSEGASVGPGPGGKATSSHDPHGFFAWRAKQARETAGKRRRQLKPLERKHLTTLHLSEKATKEEIKARFKELVKQHHPDANGGDRRTEEKLREIITAYNYLKQAGLV